MDSNMDVALKALKYFAAGFCLAMVFSAGVGGADGPMSVEGVIKKDTAWSGEVVVQGDVLVPAGVTLTIAPGTRVTFMPSDSTKIEPMFLSMQTELLVRGVLLAKGEGDRPIYFGPASEALTDKKPERGDWGGLIFDGGDSSKSVVSHARIVKADTAVTVYNSSPSVLDSRIEDDKYGVVSEGGSRPVLSGTVITGCELGVLASHGGRPALTGARVEKNGQDLLIRE